MGHIRGAVKSRFPGQCDVLVPFRLLPCTYRCIYFYHALQLGRGQECMESDAPGPRFPRRGADLRWSRTPVDAAAVDLPGTSGDGGRAAGGPRDPGGLHATHAHAAPDYLGLPGETKGALSLCRSLPVARGRLN